MLVSLPFTYHTFNSNETLLVVVPLFTFSLNNYTFCFKNLILWSRLKIESSRCVVQ